MEMVLENLEVVDLFGSVESKLSYSQGVKMKEQFNLNLPDFVNTILLDDKNFTHNYVNTFIMVNGETAKIKRVRFKNLYFVVLQNFDGYTLFKCFEGELGSREFYSKVLTKLKQIALN